MVKKYEIAIMLNTGTDAAPAWKRIQKSTTLTISMNPQTVDLDYIADVNPTTELKNYKPTLDQDLTMYRSEEDYKMIWPYFYEMRTGSDAHIGCMIVFKQEGDPVNGYAAWLTDSILSVQDMNAVESKLNFQILFGGTIETGTAKKSGDEIIFTPGGTVTAPDASTTE